MLWLLKERRGQKRETEGKEKVKDVKVDESFIRHVPLLPPFV